MLNDVFAGTGSEPLLCRHSYEVFLLWRNGLVKNLACFFLPRVRWEDQQHFHVSARWPWSWSQEAISISFAYRLEAEKKRKIPSRLSAVQKYAFHHLQSSPTCSSCFFNPYTNLNAKLKGLRITGKLHAVTISWRPVAWAQWVPGGAKTHHCQESGLSVLLKMPDCSMEKIKKVSLDVHDVASPV